MRLFTELGPNTFEEIQSLVNEGKYESVEQFLRVAAQNQLAIEKSQEMGDIHNSAPTTTQSTNSTNDQDRFQWGYSPPADVPTGTPYELNRNNLLLFSQYYRFFSLKCALCKIAELTAQAGGPVLLDKAEEHVATEIEPIRDALVSWEEENNIKKHNRKSTGLPKKDVKNPERSMKRYLAHYVGKIQRQKGEPAGFGHDLGFLAFEQNGTEWKVQLTLTGSRFVQLTNPILAGGPEEPTLSDQEQAFIVTTLRNDLDEEYRFMKYIYDVLTESEGSYTDHLDQFRDFLEESSATPDDLSDNSVRSYVGGAISRMVELSILERGQRRGWYDACKHPNEFDSVTISTDV